MLTTALLVVEHSGWYEIEMRHLPVWAGQPERAATFAIQTGSGDPGWPTPSVEGELCSGDQEREVTHMVEEWLGEMSPDPAVTALMRGREHLVERGIVVEHAGRRWRIFSRRAYTIRRDRPIPATAEAVALAERCIRERPEVWTSLNRDVRRGLSSHKMVDPVLYA